MLERGSSGWKFGNVSCLPKPHRQNNDPTDERRSSSTALVRTHMLEELFNFSSWTRLHRKPRQNGKSRPLFVLVQQWRSMKILLLTSAHVEKYCTCEFRASRAMVVIAAKDTATRSNARFICTAIGRVGPNGERRVSIVSVIGDNVPEAPSNETAGQIFDGSCDALYCTVQAGNGDNPQSPG
jgi:hypothetical protein